MGAGKFFAVREYLIMELGDLALEGGIVSQSGWWRLNLSARAESHATAEPNNLTIGHLLLFRKSRI